MSTANNQKQPPPSRSRNSPGSGNQNQTTNSSGSRFGSGGNSGSRLPSGLSRFGRGTVDWTIMPLANAAIRISLKGLGDPFHRLLGTPLNLDYTSPEPVIAALQNDAALHDKLAEVLDEAWQSYELSGAALLYPWDDDIQKAFQPLVYPPVPQPEQDNTNDNEDDLVEVENPQFTIEIECLRAIDAAFVMNILARARSNVVAADTPLALEPGFLKRTFICDDPRIVAVAKATGCLDEVW